MILMVLKFLKRTLLVALLIAFVLIVFSQDSIKTYTSSEILDTIDVIQTGKPNLKEVGFYSINNIHYYAIKHVPIGVLIRNNRQRSEQIMELWLSIKSMECDSAVIRIFHAEAGDSVGERFFEKTYGFKEIKKGRIDVSGESLFFPLDGIFISVEPKNTTDTQKDIHYNMCRVEEKDELYFLFLKGRWYAAKLWRFEGSDIVNPRFSIVVEETK